MRILFVTIEDISLHKGSSTHIREKVAALKRRGHRVIVIGSAREDAGLTDFRNIGSIRKKGGQIGYFALAVAFLKLMFLIARDSGNTDIVYVREPVAAFAAVLTKPVHHSGIIFEVNSLDNEEIRMKGDTPAIRFAYRAVSVLQSIDAKFSDKIIVITDRVKDYYRKNYGIPADRIKVLGVTTDPEKFHPIGDEESLNRLRDRLKIPEDSLIISFIGNLAHWQDFDLLVESAGIVIERNPKIYFVITGDGSQRERIERAVASPRLREKILLTGSVPHSEVALHINISDICVAVCKELASGYSPMKLFEYFACGKPVVATRVAGYEVVERVKAGKLVAGGDAEGFASAILALAEDEALRKECGENALGFARKHCGWDAVIAEIESLMEEIAPASAADGN